MGCGERIIRVHKSGGLNIIEYLADSNLKDNWQNFVLNLLRVEF